MLFEEMEKPLVSTLCNTLYNIVQYTCPLWLVGKSRVLSPISVPKGRNIIWCPIKMHNYGTIKMNYLEKSRKVPTENLAVGFLRKTILL